MASSDSNNSYYTEEVMELFVSDSKAKEFSVFSLIDENNNTDPAKISNVNKKSDRTNTSEGPGKNKKGNAPMKRKNKLPNDISKKKKHREMKWIDKMNSETYIICWKGFRSFGERVGESK